MGVAGQIFTHARTVVEATRGAGGTPTTKIIFDDGDHKQTVNTIYPSRLSGSYEDHFDATPGSESNEFSFSGLVDFNQMPFWGNLFFKGLASGTGAGADKTWAFLPTQTSDDLKSAAIQFAVSDTLGGTQNGWSVPYCVGDEFKLGYSKSLDSPGITFDATLRSPKAATKISALTGSAPEPSLQLASHINTFVTIDSTTLGATTDNFVTKVDFTLKNNWVDLFSLNNTATAQDTFRPNGRDWSATITRYYSNNTEYDAFVAKAPRKIRIRTNGITLGATTYRMDLELYGVYTARSWSDADGLKMEQFTLSRRYDTTAGTSVNLNIIAATATV